MFRVTGGNVCTKHDQIRFLAGGDAAKAVITQQLVSLIQGGRFDHLLNRDSLRRIMQRIRPAGKLADDALLHADQRVGRIRDGVVAGGGHNNARIKEGLHRKLMFGAVLPQNSCHHIKIGRFHIEPVRIRHSCNAQPCHAGDICPVHHLQMRDGIPEIMGSCLLQRLLRRIQRHGQRAVSNRMDMHRETELMGSAEYVCQGLQVKTELSSVLMLFGPGIRIGFLQEGSRRSSGHGSIQLNLDIAQIKHGPFRLFPEFCSMLDLCHGIVIFRLENLVCGENMHFQLSFRVQLMACQGGMIRAVPVNDRIQGQCLSVCQIFVLVVQDSLFVLLHREHGKRFQKVHGAFAEVTGGASVFVPGDDSVTDVRRILIDSQAVHGSMVHPVGMMADVRKHHRLICQTLKKICCRTVRSHIRCGDKPRPLNDVQLRIPFDEFLYRLQMFFQGTGLV